MVVIDKLVPVNFALLLMQMLFFDKNGSRCYNIEASVKFVVSLPLVPFSSNATLLGF